MRANPLWDQQRESTAGVSSPFLVLFRLSGRRQSEETTLARSPKVLLLHLVLFSPLAPRCPSPPHLDPRQRRVLPCAPAPCGASRLRGASRPGDLRENLSTTRNWLQPTTRLSLSPLPLPGSPLLCFLLPPSSSALLLLFAKVVASKRRKFILATRF